jgi:hypothetical protein
MTIFATDNVRSIIDARMCRSLVLMGNMNVGVASCANGTWETMNYEFAGLAIALNPLQMFRSILQRGIRKASQCGWRNYKCTDFFQDNSSLGTNET